MSRDDLAKIIRIKLGGELSFGEFTVSSPSDPLYRWTATNCPFLVTGVERQQYADARALVLDPTNHLCGIWSALFTSGHFLQAQFEHDGLIRLWAGGSTTNLHVRDMLLEGTRRYLPPNMRVELVN